MILDPKLSTTDCAFPRSRGGLSVYALDRGERNLLVRIVARSGRYGERGENSEMP